MHNIKYENAMTKLRYNTIFWNIIRNIKNSQRKTRKRIILKHNISEKYY